MQKGKELNPFFRNNHIKDVSGYDTWQHFVDVSPVADGLVMLKLGKWLLTHGIMEWVLAITPGQKFIYRFSFKNNEDLLFFKLSCDLLSSRHLLIWNIEQGRYL